MTGKKQAANIYVLGGMPNKTVKESDQGRTFTSTANASQGPQPKNAVLSMGTEKEI